MGGDGCMTEELTLRNGTPNCGRFDNRKGIKIAERKIAM